MKFFYCTVLLALVLVNVEAKFDFKGRDKMDRGFLKDVDAETKKKFLEIYKNKDLTKRQVEEQIEQLVAGLPDAQKVSFVYLFISKDSD